MQERIDSRPDRERTRALFTRFIAVRERLAQDGGEPDSEYERLRDELVVAHLNLARFLAVKFANRGEPLDDLVQVGTVGLLKAIDRFDTERGVEFTTYATPTIVGEIKRYFRDKGWAVKVPRRLQELNLAVNRAGDKLAIELGRSPTVAELAAALSAGEEEILEAQELGQAYNLLSLDSEVSGETDRKTQTLSDTVGVSDARTGTARRPGQSRARIRRAVGPRARDHLPALLRVGLANGDRQAVERLADARLASPSKGVGEAPIRPGGVRPRVLVSGAPA